MRVGAAGLVVGVLLLSGTTGAEAQTVIGGVGIASSWDDETFLGRGPAVSGGVAQPLGRHTAVEGELAWLRQVRDAGYLAASGTPLVGTARLAWLFQSPGSHARPFASAGLAVMHSSGTLTTRSTVRGPRGLPVERPASQRAWSLTRPAFEVGAGVSIASGGRMAIRPELRWLFTRGPSPASAIEPPIWMIRGGVTVEWRLGT